MKSLLFAFISFAAVTAQAQSEYCTMKPLASVKRADISSKPSYFFRILMGQDKVSFASDNKNYILDLNTQKIFKLPGKYDPVPMGETVMSVPDKKRGMAFYSIEEILNGNATPPVLFRSKSMKGVYQSTGLIERHADHDLYGIIAAGARNIQFQKIKVSRNPKLKVEPVGPVSFMCSGLDIKLPMLSKNAQEISGFDVEAGVSKVWRLNQTTGQCDETDNLGLFASKADFSYDSKKLTFHISASGYTYKLKKDGSGEIDWVETPTPEMSNSVYQYDRATKSMIRVSFNQAGSNSYYPVYQKDGSILYAVVEASGDSRFELVSPHQIRSNIKRLMDKTTYFDVLSYLALGLLWNQACSPENPTLSPEVLAATGLNLKTEDCQNLVHDHWNQKNRYAFVKGGIKPTPGSRLQFRQDLMGLVEKQDLLKACQSL